MSQNTDQAVVVSAPPKKGFWKLLWDNPKSLSIVCITLILLAAIAGGVYSVGAIVERDREREAKEAERKAWSQFDERVAVQRLTERLNDRFGRNWQWSVRPQRYTYGSNSFYTYDCEILVTFGDVGKKTVEFSAELSPNGTVIWFDPHIVEDGK
jgi:hypothetical protein